jgi:hypothetical protein
MLVRKIKATILSWWGLETCMSPNKKKVARKKLAPKVYEEKPNNIPWKHKFDSSFCFIFDVLFCLQLINHVFQKKWVLINST